MKVMLIKYLVYGDVDGTEDSAIKNCIVKEYSEFTEVDDSAVNVLRQWVYRNSYRRGAERYMLVTEADVTVKTALADQLAFIKRNK